MGLLEFIRENMAVVVSFIALILSFSKDSRQIVTNTITLGRKNDLDKLRKYTYKFAKTYKESPSSNRSKKLETIRTKIVMYMRIHSGYATRLQCLLLNMCQDNNICNRKYDEFIEQAQNLVNYKWRRMKQEAGIKLYLTEYLPVFRSIPQVNEWYRLSLIQDIKNDIK